MGFPSVGHAGTGKSVGRTLRSLCDGRPERSADLFTERQHTAASGIPDQDDDALHGVHRDRARAGAAGFTVHGIVERLSDEEGCMVCRYGDKAAREEEVISCTEEGARPVASIATTTAWAGAMMAVFGLIETSVHRGIELPRLQWHQGSVAQTTISSKPPWMNEPCLRHI